MFWLGYLVGFLTPVIIIALLITIGYLGEKKGDYPCSGSAS